MAEVRRLPARAGEVRHWVGSPAAVRRALGFEAQCGLRDGLAAVLAWLRAGRPGVAGP